MHKTARPAAAPVAPAPPFKPRNHARQHARHESSDDAAFAHYIASCTDSELARHDRLAVLRERHRARKAAARVKVYEPPAPDRTRRPCGARPTKTAQAQTRRRKRPADDGAVARTAKVPARERRSKPVDNVATKLAASPSMHGARAAMSLSYRMPGIVPLQCLFDSLLGVVPPATAAAAVAAAHRSGRLSELVSAHSSFEDAAGCIMDAYNRKAEARRASAVYATIASHTLCLEVATSSTGNLL